MAHSPPVRSLEDALAAMDWTVEEGSFTLLGFPESPEPADLECLAGAPAQIVREAGETTLLVREEQAIEILSRHPGARVERDLAWIRFETAMGWEVVGFLALVSGELARSRVPIGVVCGFSRDHLFVAREHLPAAREALVRLFGGREPEAGSG